MILTIFSQAKLKRKFPYQILGIFSTKNLELMGKVSCGHGLSMCEKCVWTTLTALRIILSLPLSTPCPSGLEGGYSREAGHTLPTSPYDCTPNGRLPGESMTLCLGVGFLLNKVRKHWRAEQTGLLRLCSFRAYFAILIYFTFKQSWLLTVYLPNLTLSAIFKN